MVFKVTITIEGNILQILNLHLPDRFGGGGEGDGVRVDSKEVCVLIYLLLMRNLN